MSYRNNTLEYSLANEGDSHQLLELFEDMDFSGNISVLFTRRPNPYNSLMLEGNQVIIPIVRDSSNGIICAMGCCIIRKAFINGQIKNVGYLTGLKIRKEYKSKLYLIRDVYNYLYQETKDKVDIYYSTILEDNKQAQKLLEKKRKNMPLYDFKGDYTVYFFAHSNLNRILKKTDYKRYKFEKGNINGLEEFYKNKLSNFNFSPIDTGLYGINSEDFYALRNESGDIIAACCLWDQREYKQYIVTKYSGVFKYINRLPTNWLGYPNFPKENIPANYASISLFYVDHMDLNIGEYFLRQVAKSSKQYEFLMLGLYENHDFNKMFKHIKHIKYKSRLYTVSWTDEVLDLDGRSINIEVGLL